MVFFGISALIATSEVNSGQSSPNELTRDTVKAAELSRRADYFSKSGRLDSAIIFYSAVATIYQQHNLEALYASTLIFISEQFSLAGQAAESLKYASEAFNIAKKLNDRKLLARSHGTLGSIEANAGKPDSALYHFRKALEIGIGEYGEKSYYVSDWYGNIGVCFMQKQDFLKAISFLNKAVDLFPVGAGIPEDNLNFFYYYLGMSYQQIANHEEALRYYKMFYDYFYPKYGDGHPLVAGSYNNLAEMFKLTGRLDDAIIYIQRARMLLEATRGRNDPAWINVTNNMAGILSEIGQYREALSLMLIVKNFYISKENFAYEYAAALNSMGHIYEKMQMFDSSGYYYQQSLKAAGNAPERQDLVCTVFSNMGVMYARINQYPRAIDIMNQAIRQFQGTGIEGRATNARLFFNLGNIYTDYGQIDNALKTLQKSLIFNVRDFQDTNRYTNPTLTGISDKGLLIKTLTTKATALRKKYYDNGNCDLRHLKASFQSAYLAIQAIDSLKSDRSTAAPDVKNIKGLPYSTGIETAYLLYHLTGERLYFDKAFEISEKSKYYTLYQSINELNARNIGGVPDSLQDEERLLRMRVGNISKALESEHLKPNPDPERIKMLEQRQFLAKARSDSLVRLFEQHFPAYYQLKYERKTVTVGQVMKSLNPGHAVVEYAAGLNRVVIFVITPTTSTMVSSTEKWMLDRVDDLRSIIRKRDISDPGRKAYCEAAGHLYNLFLAPVEPLIRGKRLTIIPDGKLGTIPFEALINPRDTAGMKSYSTLPYITRDYAIGYGYSSTLYLSALAMKENRAENSEIIAFAPSFGNHQRLLAELKERGAENCELAGARDEVMSIAKEHGGKVFLDTAATLQNFLSFAPEHNILHISTHGILNDESPLESKLVFYQKSDSANADLYIHNLFTMKLNANLVVLSACNTGFGKVTDGEGIISLSGAFMYTGVSSLVSTLWSVNDRSTATVIRSFYHYLYKSENKPEALRLARLEYLGKADNLMAHPYYWAGFIAIGNDLPLPGFSFVNTVAIVAAVLLILAMAILLVRYLKRKV